MERLDYEKVDFEKVSVCGIECEFSSMRIDRDTVPEGKYQYEAAGDDDSGGDPARLKQGILVNFFGTLNSSEPLPVGDDSALWLKDSDFVWLYRFVNELVSVKLTRMEISQSCRGGSLGRDGYSRIGRHFRIILMYPAMFQN